MTTHNNDTNLTSFIYEDLSWGNLYRVNDGSVKNYKDNNSEKYILESLRVMNIKPKALKGMKVFNVGSGREARYFASNGALVTHLDITKKSGNELKKWAFKNSIEITTINGDITKVEIGENNYDLIFLAGIYQHLNNPALVLVKLMNSLNKNGLMYLGFYRSGEFKYFIVDAIRYIISSKMMSMIRNMNAILFTFSNFEHYQSARVMDDFFVPLKHNFHPIDIIHDVKLLKGDIYYFDGDLREYNHESDEYFSIGGDRIYIKKKHKKIFNINNVKEKLKTIYGKNQLFDVSYKEEIINENIELISKIRILNKNGFISDINVATLAIGLYQFTRPHNFKKNYFLEKTKKLGRHCALNKYLKNFLSSFYKND